MSREIKFRAWFVESETMYSWEDLINHIGIGASTFVETMLWKPMQYTGLKDKDGMEIYEGDIVEYFQFSRACSKCAHRDKNVDEVKFNSLGATLSSYRIIDPEANITELKVIGDIHQNLEILK